MRAKRNEEVKSLETTLNHLQDRNEQLEAQNKEYATCLQQLQQEMRSLRSQLQQASVASSQHQQQSSSEVHQVSLAAVAVAALPAWDAELFFFLCRRKTPRQHTLHTCMHAVNALNLRPPLPGS